MDELSSLPFALGISLFLPLPVAKNWLVRSLPPDAFAADTRCSYALGIQAIGRNETTMPQEVIE
jgi:hypothetical protein